MARRIVTSLLGTLTCLTVIGTSLDAEACCRRRCRPVCYECCTVDPCCPPVCAPVCAPACPPVCAPVCPTVTESYAPVCPPGGCPAPVSYSSYLEPRTVAYRDWWGNRFYRTTYVRRWTPTVVMPTETIVATAIVSPAAAPAAATAATEEPAASTPARPAAAKK
jgi:hypothetical protein